MRPRLILYWKLTPPSGSSRIGRDCNSHSIRDCNILMPGQSREGARFVPSEVGPRLNADGRCTMKKMALVVLGLFLCSVIAVAAPKDSSWDGWISDSKCAAKGANAAHAQCAKKCIEAGEKPVLVTDKDQKVVAIENPAAVAGHEGEHVKVTGIMTASGSLHVDKVTPLS